MNNNNNQVPYLRTSRQFPEDLHQLCTEINKAYIDIANSVNNRTISIFPSNQPGVTGESWFNNNQKQQSLRKVYNITSTSSFNHGLNFSQISFFTVIRGIGFDGTNYFPIPYLSTNPVFNLGIFVSPTQVVLDPGTGRTLTKGIVLLEWISNV